jgi:hypothetical protein
MRTTIGILIALCCWAGIANAQAPLGLRAESPASLQPHVSLSWNGPEGAAFFKIYRSSPDSANFQWIGISQNQQYDDPTVTSGTSYYYYVTAISRHDTVFGESPRSNIVSIRAFTLGPGPKGTIAGTVTDLISGVVAKNITLRFFKLPSPTNKGLDIAVSGSGTFSAVVDTGTYILRAESNVALTPTTAAPYNTQWYLHANGPDDATRISVKSNDTARIVFPLTPVSVTPYAYVSGIVTDTLGQPLAGAVVAFLRPIQELITPSSLTGPAQASASEIAVIPGLGYARGVAWYGYTNASGKFFAQLSSHRNYVALAVKDGYFARYYDDVADPTQATILPVLNDTTGVNFILHSKTSINPGSVEGTVKDSTGTEIPSRIILFPRPKEGNNVQPVFTYTDSTGYFLFEDVEAGAYNILAVPFTDCAPSFATTSGATAVSWLQADTVVVDASKPHVAIAVPTLAKSGITRVSGRVVSGNGTPLAGVRILAMQSASTIVGYGLTGPDGRYTVEALGSGSITMLADRFRYNIVEAPLTIPLSTFTLGDVDFVLTSSYPLSVASESGLPDRTALMQNYPNPFNPSTQISYSVGASTGAQSTVSNVRLAVYDLLGREVAVLVDERQEAGTYVVTWHATENATGVYIYRLTTSSGALTRKMILVK